MNLPDIEQEARETYRVAGFDSREPAKMLDLARCILGPSGVQTVPFNALPSDGFLAQVNGERRIYLRHGLSEKRRRFVIGHELGHYILGIDSSKRENEEFCDRFSAALIAPREAFELALGIADGPNYTKLATMFSTTESCTALRFGEVTDTPVALVTPQRTRVRGAQFNWPSKMNGPGLHSSKLRDGSGRFAVRVSLTG